MQAIAEYRGALLSHVETLYRPGDRDIALELVEALGCAVTDTGFKADNGSTFLAVHPNIHDKNVTDNVFYMSEMTAEHAALEMHLQSLADTDTRLATALVGYRAKARDRPFGIPHFALRYANLADVEAVEKRLAGAVSLPLRQRVAMRVFEQPGDEQLVARVVQSFVYQDVIVSGCFLLGQLIELQVHPALAIDG
jgi:hypothetical protein